MKIILGSDHAGFELKEAVKSYLLKAGIDLEDLGAYKYIKTDDYPDYAEKVAEKVSRYKGSRGILFCGSAEGICIAANKFKGIRAVAVWTEKIAKISREHNDANILCLAGGKTLAPIPSLPSSKAKKIVNIWLKTPFSKEPRHKRRLNKIKSIEDRWKNQ